ncbi:hypothetical protein HAX54_051225, partial [Datura stramonium]|nr:hypothetical protein [Datura stramonium]
NDSSNESLVPLMGRGASHYRVLSQVATDGHSNWVGAVATRGIDRWMGYKVGPIAVTDGLMIHWINHVGSSNDSSCHSLDGEPVEERCSWRKECDGVRCGNDSSRQSLDGRMLNLCKFSVYPT